MGTCHSSTDKTGRFHRIEKAVSALLCLTAVLIGIACPAAAGADGTSSDAAAAMNETWFSEKEPVTDYDYSFAVIGDPQHLLNEHTDNLHCLNDWVVSQVEEKNIQWVFNLGDTVNNDWVWQWETQREEYDKFDGVVPYSMVRGNHDSTRKMNRYFPVSSLSHVGGSFNGTPQNVYQTFSVGEIPYLVLTLDYGARDEVLEWAGKVIEAYPEHNVIITTHSYMEVNGLPGTPEGTAAPSTNYGFNDGCDMWEKLIRKYDNIVLVLSGHVPNDEIVMKQTAGDHGNLVTQMLVDPQTVDAVTPGGVGLVMMMYFSEGGRHVQIEYYSTVRSQYFMTANQFEFDLNVVSHDKPATKIEGTVSTLLAGRDMTVRLERDGAAVYTGVIPAAGEEIPSDAAGLGKVTRSFCLENVPRGMFDLVIEQEGSFGTVLKNVTVDGNVVLKNNPLNMVCGDLSGDRFIDSIDISLLVSDLGKKEEDAAYDASDLNRDGYRDAIDVTLMSSYLLAAVSEDYQPSAAVEREVPPPFTGERQLQLHNCDSTRGSHGTNLYLVSENAPEGSGYLASTDAKCPVIVAKFARSMDLSAYREGSLSCKVYIDDVDKLKNYIGFDLWDTRSDRRYVVMWTSFTKDDGLTDGWNELELRFADAERYQLDFTRVDHLRVFANVSSEATLAVDDIRINYLEPDAAE